MKGRAAVVITRSAIETIVSADASSRHDKCVNKYAFTGKGKEKWEMIERGCLEYRGINCGWFEKR